MLAMTEFSDGLYQSYGLSRLMLVKSSLDCPCKIEWLTLVPFNSLFSLHTLCNLYVLSYYLMLDEMLNCPGTRVINSRF
jgi:hypothetical protein